MPDYRVTWEIDLEADSPEEAAVKALGIQRKPESIATCFDVQDDDGAFTQVDLDELIVTSTANEDCVTVQFASGRVDTMTHADFAELTDDDHDEPVRPVTDVAPL